ncbi:MAG: SAP domain-containing protein [Sandaracinus sp.]|nr:SAP domain-containing protein [Sandaracinus sp.]
MPALREPVPDAVRRFVAEGFLRPSLVEEKLETLRVSELKEALAKSQLKVSGRKADLIERLVAQAPADAKALAAGLPKTYGLTDAAREHVARYLKWEADRTASAVAAVKAALERGDISSALRAHAAFLELDAWADPTQPYPTREQTEFLQAVAVARPGILRSIADAQLPQLRMATALTHLFGRAARDALPTGFAAGSHLDDEAAARMMTFYVGRERERQQHAEADFFSRVKILTCDDERTCAACKKLAKRTYARTDVPELPFPACTSPIGCRCLALPVLDD